MASRIASALGNPRFDPHGDPIPDADGSVLELVCTPLSEIPVGETAEIRQVDTRQPDRLRYIASFGLVPGIRVTVVDRQPFGGFKMSGIGSKAGGPDYLQQFCVPRTITENTMRRGFTPPTAASP